MRIYLKIYFLPLFSSWGSFPCKRESSVFSLFWIPAGACPRENGGEYDSIFDLQQSRALASPSSPGIARQALMSVRVKSAGGDFHPHPAPLPEGEGLVDKDNSIALPRDRKKRCVPCEQFHPALSLEHSLYSHFALIKRWPQARRHGVQAGGRLGLSPDKSGCRRGLHL